MENQYTGDVGDFGKFGLMRALAQQDSTLRLGLIWYLYPDERLKNDGKFTDYLTDTPKNDGQYRVCDPELYDQLRELLRDGLRKVDQIPQLNILPRTVFFDEQLEFVGPPAERPAARKSWLARALDATAKCDILLLDPDNGLECKVTRRRQRAGKYVYFDEIAPMVERGQTVIVYQHLDRSAPAEVQFARRADQLAKHLGLARPPTVLRQRSGAGRAYYFITQLGHEIVVNQGINSLTTGPWSKHFTLVC